MAISEAPLSTKTAQLTDTVLMVRPDSFGFNDQTASTNSFQNRLSVDSGGSIRDQALREFAEAVDTLQKSGIEVVVCPSRIDVATPDAVFPNNWISFHSELDGIDVIVYPMLAPNRRAERQLDQVSRALELEIDPSAILDLTYHETSGNFLEGTGSLIFNRRRKVVFAHESARTSYTALDDFCAQTGYRPVKFHAYGRGGESIYHTNVVMSIGEGFSIVCLEAIADTQERATVEDMLKKLQLQVIPISLDQLHSFCGNVLEVQSSSGRPKIIMSTTAFGAFTEPQKEQLDSFGDLVPVRIPTIEQVGGGSARCMLAEIFPGNASS